MSFFKSNTNATTNTTATETTETSNNNGGLLKGLAIGVGTLAGIGAAYFGHKVYKSHHVVADENNLEDVHVDDAEGSENVTENNETVESFNEVDTEETNESAPVEAEEAKTEETVNEAPVDEHSETEKLVNQLTEEASKCASINTASSLISSIKKMDETVGSVAGMYRTIGDNAKIDSAIAELYKAFNSYWNNLDTKISNCDKEAFVACASEIDAVNNAWWDMQYIQMNRIATETMSYVINKYAHMERVAKRKEEKAALAAETQAAQKSSDETQAEVKKSVGENQTTTKEVPSETKIGNSEVLSDDGETVTLKASVSEDSVQNVMDVINIVSVIPDREHPEKNDMPYFIRVIGGRIRGIKEPEATFLAYDAASKSNKFIDACVDVCDMTGKAICNLANSDNDPVSSMAWINRCTDELVASSIIDNTYDPRKYKAAILKARNSAIRVLSKRITPEIAKEHGLSVNEKSSNETQADGKSSGETQTEETLTYTMSEKIQEAVQQSDETAATTEPESAGQAPMSPEASSLAAKLQEVGALMRAEKWSEAAEFYKAQLTPYLADDGLTKELREEIMGIKTKATNMMMSQKQIAAKQKAAATKASKKNSKKRRRH